MCGVGRSGALTSLVNVILIYSLKVTQINLKPRGILIHAMYSFKLESTFC